jgi:type I restriction enzyme S subunit
MELKPGYKQTEVGVIPEDWTVETLGELGQAIIGLTYKPEQVADHGTLVLRSSNIQDCALKFEDNVFVHADIPSEIMAQPGDVLVCVRNGSRDLIGKTALLDERTNGMTFGAFMAVFRSPIGSLINYHFQSSALKQQVNAHLGATINQITNRSLRSFQVILPPTKRERDSIVEALQDIDDLIGNATGLIAKKRNIKQAAMQELLTGKRRLPGFEGEWEVKRLGDIAALNRNNIVPALYPDKLFTHYSLPAFDAEKAALVEAGASIGSNKFTVPASAVLVSKLNPRIPRAWAPEVVPANAVASTEWLILTPNDGIDRNYLFAVCCSPAFCEQMELAATGTTGSHQRISPSIALDIKINVTPLRDEQVAISSLLSDMDSELSILYERLQKARELKQGILQQLLTGKIRLR